MAARKTQLTTLDHVEAPMSFDQQLLRIASNPTIPVPRLKEIAELRRQLRIDDAEEGFNQAMVACQEEMRPIEADAANDSTHSKYATLYTVDKALRPVYSKYGFSLSFNTADCPIEGHLRVLCYVSRGFFTRTYQYDVAVDTKGPKGNDVMTKTHAGGSALSYAKRYLELMIFNVTIGNPGRDADDDGNAAGGLEPISPAQLAELVELADGAQADKAKFCEMLKVSSMAKIPAKRFDEAKAQLMRKLRLMQKKQAEDGAGQ